MLQIVDCGLRSADCRPRRLCSRGAAVPGRSDVDIPESRKFRNNRLFYVAVPEDGHTPAKADGGCDIGAKGVLERAIRPPLPAFARIVRICPLYSGAGEFNCPSESASFRYSRKAPEGGFRRVQFRLIPHNSAYSALFRFAVSGRDVPFCKPLQAGSPQK